MLALRDYQQDAVDTGVAAVLDGERAVCFASPTGTGKSVCILATQAELRNRGIDAWVVTPRVEIVRGMLQKLGHDDAGASAGKLVKAARDLAITTPVRLVNMLRRGDLASLPRVLIIDEVHHSTAATYEEMRLALGRCQLIGYTATPYRGTPRSTQEFIALWGEPCWIIDIPTAINRGFMSCPEFRVVPLLDDDEISVTNGEFVVRSVESDTMTRLDAIADLVTSNSGDVPTMVSVPSTDTVRAMCDALLARNVACVNVTQKTSDAERQRAFNDCINANAVLVQINVVSEGVDLPIRRLIDASPTMSPVRWMQQIGRITRPGGQSYYICTNRNVERHGYLWAGAVPPRALKDAVSAFGKQSMRSVGVRVVGLERIGKFRPVELPLADGMTGAMYGFQSVEENGRVNEYVVILHPLTQQPFTAHRVRGNAEQGYGTWQQIPALPDIDRATARSMGNGRLSDKQAAWWRKSAAYYGLDGNADVNAKAFQALPVLSNCGVRLVTV